MAQRFQKISRRTTRLLTTRFRWVAVIVVVLILGLGYVFFLSPKLAEVRQVGVFDLARTKERLLVKQDMLSATQRLVDIYDELQLDDVTRLSALLPKDRDLPSMFVQIESLAIQSGLVLDNVGFTDLSTAATAAAPVVTDETGATATTPTQVVPRSTSKGIKKISVTFSVSGGKGYEDLKRFMTNVESDIRLLDVQSFSYTPDDQGEKYQINAVTYYLAT